MKINRVKVKNFKSLGDINITLNNLTLITGVNSTGKSSLIQALLLLKQNWHLLALNNLLKKPLNINGEYVQLGNKKDILFQETYNEDIEISISRIDDEFHVKFNTNDLLLKTNFDMKKSLFKKYNLDKRFQYIQTDRIAPNIFYDLNDEFINNDNIGINGEYTAHYLAENRHQLLRISALKHKRSVTNQLLENVSLWLSEISNGIEVSTRIYTELQKVNLTYKYIYGDNTTNDYTPLNVGFGITYVLPIIVAILKAKPDDLLIIENPESHLHPAGQSKIAELCAIASANGVQIIVETHSDHFLNGIRVATKEGPLTPEQSSIYYFKKDKDELETKIDKINIDKDGSIDSYPKGFFDQFDEDLDKLITW